MPAMKKAQSIGLFAEHALSCKIGFYESDNSKNRERLAANVCETSQRLKSFATGGHVFSADESQKRAVLRISADSAAAQWKICHPQGTHLGCFAINFSHLVALMNKRRIQFPTPNLLIPNFSSRR